MNKYEKASLQGVRNALNAVSGPIGDDTWETFGERMQATIKSNVSVLDGILALDPTEDEGLSL